MDATIHNTKFASLNSAGIVLYKVLGVQLGWATHVSLNVSPTNLASFSSVVIKSRPKSWSVTAKTKLAVHGSPGLISGRHLSPSSSPGVWPWTPGQLFNPNLKATSCTSCEIMGDPVAPGREQWIFGSLCWIPSHLACFWLVVLLECYRNEKDG